MSLWWMLATLLLFCGAPLTDCVRECQVGELPSMLQSAPVTLSGLFLNVDLPATCSGAIMTLRTCFYPQECTQNFSNTVNFTMWRPVGNGTFQLVSNSSFSILLTRPEEATYDFVCQSWKLSEATTIYVEKGDVMGIMDMGAGCTLLRSNVPFHALYHLADNMPQLEVHQSQLDTLTEYAFYITAGIDFNVSTTSFRDCSSSSFQSAGLSPTPTNVNMPTGRLSVFPLWGVFLLVLIGTLLLALLMVLTCLVCMRRYRRKHHVARKRTSRKTGPGEASLIRRPTILGDATTFFNEGIPLNAHEAESDSDTEPIAIDQAIGKQQEMATESAIIYFNAAAELSSSNHSESSNSLNIQSDTEHSLPTHVGQGVQFQDSARLQSFQYPVVERQTEQFCTTEYPLIGEVPPRLDLALPLTPQLPHLIQIQRSWSEGGLVNLELLSTETETMPNLAQVHSESAFTDASEQVLVQKLPMRTRSLPNLSRESITSDDHVYESPIFSDEAQPYLDFAPMYSCPFSPFRPILKIPHTPSGAPNTLYIPPNSIPRFGQRLRASIRIGRESVGSGIYEPINPGFRDTIALQPAPRLPPPQVPLGTHNVTVPEYPIELPRSPEYDELTFCSTSQDESLTIREKSTTTDLSNFPGPSTTHLLRHAATAPVLFRHDAANKGPEDESRFGYMRHKDEVNPKSPANKGPEDESRFGYMRHKDEVNPKSPAYEIPKLLLASDESTASRNESVNTYVVTPEHGRGTARQHVREAANITPPQQQLQQETEEYDHLESAEDFPYDRYTPVFV